MPPCREALAADPSNVPLDEILAPELTTEMLEIEMAELDQQLAQIDEAEEEELWSLTLLAQVRA